MSFLSNSPKQISNEALRDELENAKRELEDISARAAAAAELDVVPFDECCTRRYYSNAPPTTIFRTYRYHGL